MRLASFRDRSGEQRVGAALSLGTGEFLVDLTRAYAKHLTHADGDPQADVASRARLPADMRLLLDGGVRALDAARDALAFAKGEADNGRQQALRDSGVLFAVADADFLPPVPRPGKIISCGANFRAHVQEVSDVSTAAAKKDAPPLPQTNFDSPPAFAKFSSTMIGHNQPIVHPKNTKQLDYEGELCVVIGKRCKDVPAESYLDVVAGFTIMNDVSMRDIQFRYIDRSRGTGSLDNLMGKNLDTTAPTGPWIVTRDEIPDPQNLQISTYVNGERRQHDNTSNMVFNIASIVAYFSRMTLEPGDIFTTGNPAGSAFGMKPPDRYWLKPGDVVEIDIEGLGRLRNPVIAET